MTEFSSLGWQRRSLWLALLGLVLALQVVTVTAVVEPFCSSSEDGECQDPTAQQQQRSRDELLETDDDYQEMQIQKASKFHAFIEKIFHKVDTYADTVENPSRVDQEKMIFTTWLEYLDMDPALIEQVPPPSNWLETLFHKTQALAPWLFFKVWDERKKPTHSEIGVLLSIDDGAYHAAMQKDGQIDEPTLMNHLFTPFRHRGFVMDLLHTFTRVVFAPLKAATYAIPSSDNLELIAQYAPLVEVGAGSGYWNALLQQRGVTIQAYDTKPPIVGEKNMYFDRTYTHVEEKSCQDVFAAMNREDASQTTLLMIWPNNPDNVDNAPEFYSDILPPVWDLDCLKAYVAAGGTRLILVAEREDNIHILPNHPENPTFPDAGLCATRQFQHFVKEHFSLKQQQPILTWYYRDDLTVWELKNDKDDDNNNAQETTTAAA